MDFRVLPKLTGLVASHHVAVAGFWSASFEGGRRSGGEPGRLLDYSVVQIRRGLTTTACHEIQRSSVSEQSGSLYEYLTRKRKTL
jgi:hypothetical protein